MCTTKFHEQKEVNVKETSILLIHRKKKKLIE